MLHSCSVSIPRWESSDGFLVLRGFPYILVYRANAVPPRILRVLHGARDLPEVLQDLERE
jgi:plasmid stabilization system protein ParE